MKIVVLAIVLLVCVIGYLAYENNQKGQILEQTALQTEVQGYVNNAYQNGYQKAMVDMQQQIVSGLNTNGFFTLSIPVQVEKINETTNETYLATELQPMKFNQVQQNEKIRKE